MSAWSDPLYLLDTDTLTHFHAGNPNVIKNLQAVGDVRVGITIITRIEVLQGRMSYVMKASGSEDFAKAQRLLERTEKLLSQILILPLDERAIAKFGTLQMHKTCHKIGRADLLIASVALAHHAVLVTRNLRHFKRVPNLTVENWVA
jgi:tRNA(fMet)-specific endonuclease VapC